MRRRKWIKKPMKSSSKIKKEYPGRTRDKLSIWSKRLKGQKVLHRKTYTNWQTMKRSAKDTWKTSKT